MASQQAYEKLPFLVLMSVQSSPWGDLFLLKEFCFIWKILSRSFCPGNAVLLYN